MFLDMGTGMSERSFFPMSASRSSIRRRHSMGPGPGFASSPNAETVLLSPQLVLLIRPGEGYGFGPGAAPGAIEKLNLRAVACSDRCIYGPQGSWLKACSISPPLIRSAWSLCVPARRECGSRNPMRASRRLVSTSSSATPAAAR